MGAFNDLDNEWALATKNGIFVHHERFRILHFYLLQSIGLRFKFTQHWSFSGIVKLWDRGVRRGDFYLKLFLLF